MSWALFSATFIPTRTVATSFVWKAAVSHFPTTPHTTHCPFRAKMWRACYLGRGPRDHLAFYPFTAAQTQTSLIAGSRTPVCLCCITAFIHSHPRTRWLSRRCCLGRRCLHPSRCHLPAVRDSDWGGKAFLSFINNSTLHSRPNFPNKHVTFAPHWHISSTHPQSGDHVSPSKSDIDRPICQLDKRNH